MTAINYKIGATNYGSLAEALASGRSGSIQVTDTAAHIATAISNNSFLINSPRISKITKSDANDVTISVSDLAKNKAVLLKLSGADLAVTGSLGDIGSNFRSLDAVYSKIKSIGDATGSPGNESDTNYVNVTYNDYKASKNAKGLETLINSFDYDIGNAGGTGEQLNVTGFSGNSTALSALLNDSKVATISINDTIANLTQNASLIMGSNKIDLATGDGVSVTDTLKNLNNDSAKALIGSVLASKMNAATDSIQISLRASELTTGTISDLNSASANMVAIRASLKLNISGTAAEISKNAQALTAALTTGAISVGSDNNIAKIKVIDGTNAKPITINLTDTQHDAIKTLISGDSTNTGRYNYKLSDVTKASAGAVGGNLKQDDPLVLSYTMKDSVSAFSTAGFIDAALTDKVKGLIITAAAASDVTDPNTGISDQYDGLTLVQKAKLKVEIVDTAAHITDGTTLADIGSKAFIKSIEATTSDVTDLTSTANTNGINIVNSKNITKITVTDPSQSAVALYVNNHTKPTKVTFA